MTRAKKIRTIETNEDEAPAIELTSGRFRRIGRGRHAGKGVSVPLADARAATGKTQNDVAGASGMQQADVSRLERRTDFDEVLVGTLRRYARALGGDLELSIVVDGDRIVLQGEKGPRAPARRARALKLR